MMRASAPGKLMLAGEYAVVGGHGPALAVALGLRAQVTCELGGEGWRVSSEALGLTAAPIEAVPVLACAVDALEGARSAGGLLTVTSELGSGPNKPGFGSSAAVCVAGLGALHGALGLERPTLDEAVAVHRASQGGRGSGYDVATALYGGLCAYENDALGPRAEGMAWRDGLCAAVIFTGQGASTPLHLERLHGAGDEAAPHLRALGDASRTLMLAWAEGSVDAVLGAASACEVALARLDAAFELGIAGGGIGAARRAVETSGAVARTSGAGGGDCIWALAANPESLGRAIASAEGIGCRALDLTWPGPGLEVDG